MAERDGSRPACLITRPEPGGSATAGRVAALGWEPVLTPALVLNPLPMEPVPEARAVLLPSAAALPSLAGVLPPGLPLLAVGEGTAEAARAAGFRDVAAAAGDAVSLAAMASARLDPAGGPVLLASGRGYGDALAADLAGRGFSVIRREVYVAAETTELWPEAREALAAGQVRAALFLSPRSAQSFVAQLRKAGLGGAATAIRAVALSGRVAEALLLASSGASGANPGAFAWGGLDVAPRPDQDALLALLGPAPPQWPSSTGPSRLTRRMTPYP
ncbi:uroporphyrinogen-III synthase [Roseomonas rosea]|uniref:Uroporphyrinogen-III synthase n=1 Tax=Muricoccus roseus TaxID=198092 RepID=A0A1M6NHV2_9PROT|nr:uroporphyrinogen-III synthase [Roseomonas rosea]SHJ95318.1 uroporphyrinogen-III synthase [Roseomonas rosea]